MNLNLIENSRTSRSLGGLGAGEKDLLPAIEIGGSDR
jgi:hypothetical protein